MLRERFSRRDLAPDKITETFPRVPGAEWSTGQDQREEQQGGAGQPRQQWGAEEKLAEPRAPLTPWGQGASLLRVWAQAFNIR